MITIDRDTALAAACHRWLNVNEIDYLLRNFHSLGFQVTTKRDTDLPPSGRIYFFLKRTYKADGYEWVRKKGRDTIREDMVKLSINGVHVITGRYTYSLATPGMCRRTYESVSPGTGAICMVHYRLCPIEELPKRAAISSVTKEREKDNELDDQLVENLMECAESMGLVFSEDPLNTSGASFESQSVETSSMIDYTESPGIHHKNCFPNKIIDFEPKFQLPEYYGGDGGTAVIICLAHPLPDSESISIVFENSDIFVEGTCLSAHTLKCRVPRKELLPESSSCFLYFSIWSRNRQSFITQLSDVPFCFKPPVDVPYAAAGLSTTLQLPGVKSDYTVEGKSLDYISSFRTIKDNGIGDQLSNSTAERNSELGVSFVEKLESVAAVLGGSAAIKRDRDGAVTPRATTPRGNMPDVDVDTSVPLPGSDGWLDDKALTKLSNSELQKLVDSFISTYMGQLVQLAAVDTELSKELNLLDKRLN